MPVGDSYFYDHPDNKGYGEHHLGQPLTTEMAELDITDGTNVVLIAEDEDSGWPIVQWTDKVGIDRITTVDPDLFGQFFKARKA